MQKSSEAIRQEMLQLMKDGNAYREAVKRSPLVTLLFTADYEASNIVEAEG